MRDGQWYEEIPSRDSDKEMTQASTIRKAFLHCLAVKCIEQHPSLESVSCIG